MKLIGLDVGDRRVGVAFGDSDLRMATPVDVFERATTAVDAERVARYVKDYDASTLIIGLPRNMDGTTGPQAQATQAFGEAIAPVVRVPIRFWDERLTTVQAAQSRPEAASRRKKQARRGLDAVAAAVILQDYMDAQANENLQHRT